MVPNTFTALNDFVSSDGPICYGILMPGSHIENGIPVVKVKNIFSGKIHTEKLLKTSIDIHQQYKRAELKCGDVLLTIRGTTGRVAIVQEELDGANITQDTARIRVSTEDCSLYLFYALQSPQTQRQIKLNTVGQAVKGINISEVKKLKILHPPFTEQREIANILGAWDKAISITEYLIDNSRQQKKALMQQLLTGKKRLLSDSGKPFESEWQKLKLSDIVKVTGGNAFKSDTFQSDGVPLVKISNIKPDYSVNLDSSVFIPQDPKFDKFQVKSGDVLIAMSGATTGKVGCYQSNKLSYLNQRVGRFDVKKGRTTNKYILQLLKQPKVQHEILIDAVGGAQPNISNKDIERIKVDIPSVEEQMKIASVLTNADQEVEILEQQLTDLKLEKKALMQQLLTGKRRVKVEIMEVA